MQRPPENLFGSALAVALSRVEEVDAVVERGMYRRDRVLVALLAPDLSAGEGPTTQCENGHVDSRVAKLAQFHRRTSSAAVRGAFGPAESPTLGRAPMG